MSPLSNNKHIPVMNLSTIYLEECGHPSGTDGKEFRSSDAIVMLL